MLIVWLALFIGVVVVFTKAVSRRLANEDQQRAAWLLAALLVIAEMCIYLGLDGDSRQREKLGNSLRPVRHRDDLDFGPPWGP
jgi:hypothetical protein